MLDLIVLYILSRSMGRRARDKGLKPLRYQIILVVLWFAGALVGVGLGLALDSESGMVLLTLGGAGTGAAISFAILSRAKPNLPSSDASVFD